ncbi:MAG TPA: cytochrome c biogenesis protein CcsA [Syntrophales bacterium]|nr:cytochrome c biogenesis protein CcsA [Syntrophales bacterium]HPI56684.1 cytochrome c biogenesis protein CcsA [Syntrophales bacterium]HPN24890.1 cytochrome c biogenesis protein CcsA [Syntrophales bacterium]
MEAILFKAALLGYLVATLGYTASLMVKRVVIARATVWLLLAAFAIHGLSLALRCLSQGLPPAVHPYETLSFFAWAMTGTYLAFQLKTKTQVLGAFVSPLAFLLMVVASSRLGVDVPVPDILKGTLVPVHVALSVTGEALLAIACGAGILYLAQDSQIRRRKMTPMSRYLPSLDDLDRVNHISLLTGFALLTAGLLVGSVWASTVWGRPWPWDPKLLWTLAAWFFYAVLIHQRLAIGWKGRKIALLSIAAFAVLLFAFVGVSSFFKTVHRFQ